MRIAETVTFGGAGAQAGLDGDWDRAAHRRGDADDLARQPDARVLPMWRGKPLIAQDCAVLLEFGHPALEQAGEPHIFLGLADGRPLFAADISAWQPEDLDPEAMAEFLDPSAQHHPALAEDRMFVELRAVMAALPPRDAALAATARAMFEWHRSHGFCSMCGVRTEPEDAGWQRRCPECGRRHFPRTDPVVIMLITDANRVLLGRSPGWPEGMYSLLAGFVEPGETLEAAVRREVAEEANVQVGDVTYLASQPWPFPASLMIGCHGLALSREITVDPVEIEQAQWVTREELMQIFAGEVAGMHPARPGSIAHFILSNWLADRLD